MHRAFIAAAVLMPLAAASATAETFCGAKVQRNVDEVRTFLGHFFVACEDAGSCRAMTYQTVKDSGVPWTHRLAVITAGKGAPLKIELTVDKGQIDVAEGYDLVIDHGEALRVPPEAIKAGSGRNDYLLNDDLNESLIKDLAGGGNVRWNYVNADDKKPATAQMSLAGMRKAMRWIKCAQKTM
jgi:hypothetical protein